MLLNPKGETVNVAASRFRPERQFAPPSTPHQQPGAPVGQLVQADNGPIGRPRPAGKTTGTGQGTAKVHVNVTVTGVVVPNVLRIELAGRTEGVGLQGICFTPLKRKLPNRNCNVRTLPETCAKYVPDIRLNPLPMYVPDWYIDRQSSLPKAALGSSNSSGRRRFMTAPYGVARPKPQRHTEYRHSGDESD